MKLNYKQIKKKRRGTRYLAPFLEELALPLPGNRQWLLLLLKLLG